MESIREKSRKRIVNRLDPMYRFLDHVVFQQLFQPPKANAPGEFERIEEAQTDFLVENLKKHRLILWVNIILVLFLGIYGLEVLLKTGNTAIVVSGLLAPAMITGAAWFAISFGGIPEKFISVAFTLTFSMYLSFTLSMTLLTCLLVAITPWFIGLFILVPIYLTLYLASILYDNVDGLKIGLDTALLKFSRATINYYQKQGLVTARETEQEFSYGEDAFVTDKDVSQFTYYLNTLERNLDQLEENKDLGIANHLIASSIQILFNIIFIALDERLEISDEVHEFVLKAHKMKQSEVDEFTMSSLHIIVSKLSDQIGDKTKGELKQIEKRLEITKESFETEVNDIEKQKLADLIFSQTFRQLLELVSAYRQFIFMRE